MIPFEHLIKPVQGGCSGCDRGTGKHDKCPWGRVAMPSRDERPRHPECIAQARIGAEAKAWRAAGNQPSLIRGGRCEPVGPETEGQGDAA